MRLFIKNMVTPECKTIVTEMLAKLGLRCVIIKLGEVEIDRQISDVEYQLIKAHLFPYGLDLLVNRKGRLIENIKYIIIEFINYSDERLNINFSDHLSGQLHYDYTYLANIFSAAEGITIEKYIISLKINRVKELIIYDDLNLTQIAWKLHYSSVAHLSNQFKKVTGITPSVFKQQSLHHVEMIKVYAA